MMTERTEIRKTIAKCLSALALTTLTMTVFARPEVPVGLNGVLANSVEQASSMSSDRLPEFPGGKAACMNFLGKNIKYPKVAQKNKIEGTVLVKFMVETDGSITNVKVVRGVSPELDAEALRVINLMPNWIPAMQKGKVVRVSYAVPIKFSLNSSASGRRNNRR